MLMPTPLPSARLRLAVEYDELLMSMPDPTLSLTTSSVIVTWSAGWGRRSRTRR